MSLFSLFYFDIVCCPTWIEPFLIGRSGATILRSDQRRHDAVQTDHSGRGRVLELPGRARRPGRALHFACLLPEEAAAETRVGHCKHLRTSSAD